MKWPKVVLFGDSLTQFSFSTEGCWGTLVADHLQRICDVICRGFSGYNTRWCRRMLPHLVNAELAKDIAAITVFLGANDSTDLDLNPRQHVPLEEYKTHLKAMVDYLKSVGVTEDKIIMISPPAFNAEAWKIECSKKGKVMSKNNETTGQYAKACMSVAKECGTKYVDLYSHMMKEPEWKGMLSDGLHLSLSGSHHLFNLLWPLLVQLTVDIPTKYPNWKEVDL